MNATPHLDSDEILERVFPADDRLALVPGHLASCVECQERVATLREAWLLDKGAVSGAVDDLPASFWEAQAASTMAAVRAGAASAEVRVFPSRVRGILRHPALAFSSLAAALLLVGGLSIVGTRGAAPSAALPLVVSVERTPALASDASDDELLVSVDRVLEDSSLGGLVVEETL